MNIKEKKITGIILAAGASSRMGYPKALLKVKDNTFSGLIRGKLNCAGIKDIFLVLGSRADYIKKHLNEKYLNIIINKSWEKGQLSSLQAAIKKLPEETDAAVVCLIDHPRVKSATFAELIKKYCETSADIVVPAYKGRGGHPVIFSSAVFKEILRAPLEKGARAVTGNPDNNVIRIPVEDKYVREDIDTQQEYRQFEKEI